MLLFIAELVAKLAMVSMLGVYFIFSNTVMAALAREDKGAKVMVSINQIILNPVFYVLFFGSAVGAAGLALWGDWLERIAAFTFISGTFVVTIVGNVPLNNRLRDSANAAELSRVWSEYLIQWTRWNHLRTGSAFVASACLLVH